MRGPDYTFPAAPGVGVRRSSFREGGRPHQLCISISQTLREEERQAGALLRVLGHELNNSLAPMPLDGRTLLQLLAASRRRPTGGRHAPGTLVVGNRRIAESAHGAYAKLAASPAARTASRSRS